MSPFNGNEISRRGFLKSAGASGLMLVGGANLLAACGGSSSDGGSGAQLAAPPAGKLPGGAGGQKFDGIKLTVVSPEGIISDPVNRFKGPWEQATGAQIETVTFPFGDIHAKYKTALGAGQSLGDIMYFGADFSGDFMGGGFMRPTPAWVKDRIDWQDLSPGLQNRILSWGGELQAAPADGDVHMLYYRTDVFEDSDIKGRFEDEVGIPAGPPRTWDEAVKVAKFFHGWDWSKRGRDSQGIAMMLKPNDSQWFFFTSVAAPYNRLKDDPSIWFDSETMEPLINGEGWVRALEIWRELKKYAPPNALNSAFADTKGQFASGDTFMVLDWGDLGTLSYDKKASVVNGKTGFAMTPGTNEVWDHKAKAWQKVSEINNAPFLAWNAWIVGVPKTVDDKKATAAWDFLAYMASPEISLRAALVPNGGVNPYRSSHFSNVDAWVDGSAYQKENNVPAGFPNAKTAKAYLDTIDQSYKHPNATLDLRIPGTFDYFQALDRRLGSVVGGSTSPKAALDGAAKDWNEITDRLGGKDKQLEFYRASLGL
jgi:multiple sugar transport system substrate-binding protein